MKRRIAYKIDKRWREKLDGVSPKVLRDTGRLPWNYQTWCRAHRIRFNRDGMSVRRRIESEDVRLISSEEWNRLAGLPDIHWRRATRNLDLPKVPWAAGRNWSRHRG